MDERTTVGGEVLACTASLRIFGVDLDPEEITRLLGCAPSLSYRTGDSVSPTVKTLRKQGMWLLDSALDREQSLSAHVSWLLATVSDDPAAWETVGARFAADIYCPIDVRSPNSGVELTREIVHQIDIRRLAIQLDLYTGD